MGLIDGVLSKLSKYKILNVEFSRNKSICFVEYEVIHFGKPHMCKATIFIINNSDHLVDSQWILTRVIVDGKYAETKNEVLSLKTKKEILDFYNAISSSKEKVV